MADVDITTEPTDAGPNRVSDADFLHASERANPYAQSDGEEPSCFISVLEPSKKNARG